MKKISKSKYVKSNKTIQLYGIYPWASYEVDCERGTLESWIQHLRGKKNFDSSVEADLQRLWKANVK